jgi:AraC family transcriptional regulator
VQEPDKMPMMRSRSTLLTETSEAGRGRRDAAESSMNEGHLRGREPRSRFRSSLPVESGVLQPIVQISPIDAVKRHSAGWQGLTTETIYAPAQSRIECRYRGPCHLLVMYVDGVRRDGEAFIDDLPPSTLRNVANKLTFVPANHAYNEWHETQTPMRISYLYLDPSMFNRLRDEDTVYAPKAFFDDSAVWNTVTKLRHVIESGKANKSYVDALTNVLAHELSRSDEEESRDSPVNRGGLATWQMRTATKYIEEHLGEQISLVTLAKLARLSPSHFCRAFKQSFGVPPHEYHIQRRIEKAKALLAEREASVTNIGFALGYCHTSSFSVAFRKIIGRSPRAFRRDFT